MSHGEAIALECKRVYRGDMRFVHELRMSFGVCLALCLPTGCSLARGVTSTSDAAAEGHDAFVLHEDAGTQPDAFVAPVDAGSDAFVAPVDGGHDAFVAAPDGGVNCDSVYAGAIGSTYFACPAINDTSCVFYENVGNSRCDDLCRAAGGGHHCIGAIDNATNSGTGRCQSNGSPQHCGDTFTDAICTCSFP